MENMYNETYLSLSFRLDLDESYAYVRTYSMPSDYYVGRELEVNLGKWRQHNPS